MVLYACCGFMYLLGTDRSSLVIVGFADWRSLITHVLRGVEFGQLGDLCDLCGR